MIFKDPWILTLIPIAIMVLVWINRHSRKPSLRFPSTELVAGLSASLKTRLSDVPFYLRCLIVGLFILALSGPRSVLEESRLKVEGIDIVLAIDASGSMAAEDFVLKGERVNRLHIVKDVVQEFIEGRPYDRIGLVAFAGLAYTVSPLTMDHQWINSNLQRVELGLIEDGTAIGSAISSALSRLRESEAKSKIIILLTDGMNNAGKMDPLIAAQAAQALGIKIYTIGAGSHGKVPFPIQDVWGRTHYRSLVIEMDKAVLKKIAAVTDGQYFRATDTESLREIYQQIDQLEKTEIEELGYREYKELFAYVLLLALGLLILEIVLSHTYLLRVP